MPSDTPLCGGCLPPHCWPPVTQSVWLCPKHQAEQDARMEKYGHLVIKRTERES